MAQALFVCSGCGATTDPGEALPFRCPEAEDGDDIDHVLVRRLEGNGNGFPPPADPTGDNPFVRYRRRLSAYHLARRHGLSDDDFTALVGDLDESIRRVDGHGFRVTPFGAVPGLAGPAGAPEDVEIWVKDETANVGGSHKARHLMGVMIYLAILERTGLPLGRGLRDRRLAIASCGNAALAAAVVARAADWPIDVFIPSDAETAVVRRLKDLGAECHVCHRMPDSEGDPCYLAFRQAVAAGSLPFGVQGNEVGLAIEGGHTLGWEMAETLAAGKKALDLVVVQVGGGALASACHAGFREAAAAGLIDAAPRLYTVQTAGAYPLHEAFVRFMDGYDDGDLAEPLRQAARSRGTFMRPWPTEPKSIAHGILDDETYDWLALVAGMAETGGDALVVDEERLEQANRVARNATGIAVSHTGSAGLAGLMELFAGREVAGKRVAVLFTGADRG